MTPQLLRQLAGNDALPALAGTAALFCVVTTWGGTR